MLVGGGLAVSPWRDFVVKVITALLLHLFGQYRNLYVVSKSETLT